MTDLLLYLVLGLQGAALLLNLVLWRRQGSSNDDSSVLPKAHEDIETLLREELASSRRELVEQFEILQRDNSAFREGLKESLGTFTTDVAGQIEAMGATNQNEAAQGRAQLLRAFDQFGSEFAHHLDDATSVQDRRFEQFEKRLDAGGERTAGQIHSLDDAVIEQMENLREEIERNREINRAKDDATLL